MSRRSVAEGGCEGVNPYGIEWVRFKSGERFPLIVRRETGLPIEAPTYWIAASERPLNKAATTLEKRLRHLMFLYLWADARGTSPEGIVRSLSFFTLEQINDLDRFCRQSLAEAIVEACKHSEEYGRIIPIQRGRQGSRAQVALADVGSRLAAIQSFLEYVSFAQVARLEPGSDLKKGYQQSREFALDVLRERARSFRAGPATQQVREGLSASARAALLAAIKFGAQGNPWLPQVQRRNELIVSLMFELGLRRGEVLCLRVADFKVTPDAGVVTIVRRPQDASDPRQPKPQVKTLGRELPLSSNLRDLFVLYLAERRKISGARKHPFLLVSSTDGSPLSYWNLTAIFRSVRKCDGVPGDITAHVLRHDWNDRFSEMSDAASPKRSATDAVKEERLRAYAMGWTNPHTASTYTKRWARESSNRRILEMQQSKEIPTDVRSPSAWKGRDDEE